MSPFPSRQLRQKLVESVMSVLDENIVFAGRSAGLVEFEDSNIEYPMADWVRVVQRDCRRGMKVSARKAF